MLTFPLNYAAYARSPPPKKKSPIMLGSCPQNAQLCRKYCEHNGYQAYDIGYPTIHKATGQAGRQAGRQACGTVRFSKQERKASTHFTRLHIPPTSKIQGLSCALILNTNCPNISVHSGLHVFKADRSAVGHGSSHFVSPGMGILQLMY